jgi:predicted dienelactone hydrolase
MAPPKRVFLLMLVVLLFLLPAQSWSQLLPEPSGKFRIGHYRFEWTDSSRTEPLADDGSFRRIVADIWYPADNAGAVPVVYLDTVAISKFFGEKGLRSLLGEQGARRIRSGTVHTHAWEDILFTRRLKSAPVVFFSHGMGMISQLYTAQVEELASHGYIVVALQHTYDAWLVSFSDGRQVPFETKQRKLAGNSEEQHIAYENKRLEWWAGDIRFALDRLTVLNGRATRLIPFAGFMDLTKVGAAGHSSGGRAAARACQLDSRIKSCADLDGVAMMQPFYLDSNGVGMKQPFLLFERVTNHVLDESDAASLGMTLDSARALVARLRAQKVAALKATGGSFHVLLNFERSSHMSFSDVPALQAGSSPEASAALQLLRTTRRYTREFFVETLLGIPSPLYGNKEKLRDVDTVETR